MASILSSRIIKKHRGFTPTGNEKTAVQMDNVSSMELFVRPDERYRNVLYSLSLTVPVGVCHGITGDGIFELQLVSEIIGNVKPHEMGQCSLMEIGMMRQKRLILPHVYYINDQRVLYGNMHVLGLLMFASQHEPGKPEAKQREWLKLLLRTGLYPIALTYIQFLNPAEYAIVSALIACGSKARLVIMDLSHINVPESLITPFSSLMRELTAAGKTVVLSSCSRALVQTACSQASFLINGTIVESGSVASLCAAYDKRVLCLDTPKPDAAVAALTHTFPAIRTRTDDNTVSLYCDDVNKSCYNVSTASAALEAESVPFSSIRISTPSLEEAFCEVKRKK